jgi:acyl carrier protein
MSGPPRHGAARPRERSGEAEGADELTRFLAELVAAVSDGEVSSAEVLAAPLPFAALGITSLAQLRLIDEIERTFDIAVDLFEEADDLRSLAALLRRHGVQGPP